MVDVAIPHAIRFFQELRRRRVVHVAAIYGAAAWGTLVVAWTNTDVSIVPQFVGVVAIGAFVLVTSTVFWLFLSATVGLRPTEEEEFDGLDKAEIGLEAYPEFGSGSQRI